MNDIRVETTVEADGELHLTSLPYRRGDTVEAVVRIVTPAERIDPSLERETARSAALERFLNLARSSPFCSTGAYPTRDELHERP